MNVISTAKLPASSAGLPMRYLLPGQLFVGAEPTRCITILGSCIAVCLYDPGRAIGGLNHFLLPDASRDATREDPLRWGVSATEALLQLMMEAGARRGSLQAKLFGGAQIGARDVPAFLRVGARNIDTARAELQRHRIPVVNECLGGSMGRRLVFESHTGMAWVKMLGRHDSQGDVPERPA